MSAGLIELSDPSKGMPSTTYNGVAEAFTDPMPRMMTDAASPGWPPPEATCTPATVPSNDLVTLPTTRFWSSPPLTTAAEPVNDSFLAVP